MINTVFEKKPSRFLKNLDGRKIKKIKA